MRRLGIGTLVGDAIWAFGIALVFAMVVFAPLLAYLDDPWSGGDMLSTYVNTHNAAFLGYAPTTHFGFPLGMDLNLAPNLDLTENWGAWLVNAAFGTTFAGLNVVLIGSFPLVAALAVVAMRLAGLRGPLAIALAVAVTFIPYHWGRGLGHTYLATMVSAFLGLILVLLIGSGNLRRVLGRVTKTRRTSVTSPRTRRGVGRQGVARWRVALLVLAVVVIAWTGMYYAAFTLLLGIAALLWRAAHGARWRALLVDALPLIGIGMLALVAFIPSLVALADNPGARELTERLPYESVVHAGILMFALLPLPMSRLPFMSGYNEWATTVAAEGGGLENATMTNFGTWTTSIAVVVMVAALLVPRWRTRSHPLLPLVGYLTTVTVLLFVPWGLGALIAHTLTPQIRAWNRLLPMLLLLFLVGAAAVLSRSRLNLTSTNETSQAERDATSKLLTGTAPSRAVPVSNLVAGSAWAVGAAVLVLLVTLLDSVAPFKAPYHESAEASATEMAFARAYGSDVNAVLPGDCGILQLPHAVYPEQGKLNELNDYEHFRVALANLTKRWSYGALKQTDAGDWVEQLKPIPTNKDVDRLVAAGFCGIHLDARGFKNDGFTMASAELTSRLGEPVATGHQGNWMLFALPLPVEVTAE